PYPDRTAVHHHRISNRGARGEAHPSAQFRSSVTSRMRAGLILARHARGCGRLRRLAFLACWGTTGDEVGGCGQSETVLAPAAQQCDGSLVVVQEVTAERVSGLDYLSTLDRIKYR